MLVKTRATLALNSPLWMRRSRLYSRGASPELDLGDLLMDPGIARAGSRSRGQCLKPLVTLGTKLLAPLAAYVSGLRGALPMTTGIVCVGTST